MYLIKILKDIQYYILETNSSQVVMVTLTFCMILVLSDNLKKKKKGKLE